MSNNLEITPTPSPIKVGRLKPFIYVNVNGHFYKSRGSTTGVVFHSVRMSNGGKMGQQERCKRKKTYPLEGGGGADVICPRVPSVKGPKGPGSPQPCDDGD